MATYLTLEKSRECWVFQMRVPTYAQDIFDGKTMIRHYIGKMSEDEAKAIADEYVKKYKNRFTECKASQNNIPDEMITADRAEHFDLDADILRRLIATSQKYQADEFKEDLQAYQNASQTDWDELASKLRNEISNIKDRLRRHDSDIATKAIDIIQKTFNVCIDINTLERHNLVDNFNAARVCFLENCLAVSLGEMPTNHLFPAHNELLPLVGLWGDPANALVNKWQTDKQSRGAHVDLKTLQKYQAICRDVEKILGRRTVQSLTKPDIKAVCGIWSGKGNIANTIKGKLRILKTLMQQFMEKDVLEALFKEFTSGATTFVAARIPFSDKQLGIFCQNVFDEPFVLEEDKILLAMQLMLGCRIEEAYKLSATDFESTKNCWVIRFADRRQTGSGSMRLKNAASARRLPLLKGVIPWLDDWLQSRIDLGGYIFPSNCKNQYGIRSADASKRLNKIVHELFPDDRRLVLQSTRNTVGRILRMANVDPRIRRRFLGHAEVDIHDRHYDPATLIDADELIDASLAIVAHISGVLRIEGVESGQLGRQLDIDLRKHDFDMSKKNIRSLPKQELTFDIQQTQI